MAYALYSEFVRQHAGQPRPEFLAEITHPVLLAPALPDSLDPVDTPFLTQTEGNPLTWREGDRRRLWLIPLRKREDGNAFSMMITLGRAQNNDVVVEHPGVSKFHAYFRRALDRWAILDASSLNGTRVEGEALDAQRPQPLRSGALITLGETVLLEFVEAADLYQRVQADAPEMTTRRKRRSSSRRQSPWSSAQHRRGRGRSQTSPDPDDETFNMEAPRGLED